MAATDARPVPIKNTAFRYYFCIRKNDGTLITTWTGADSEVSLDGAAFADCTNEATEIGTTGCGYIDLTSSEMNADAVFLKITVTNTSALTTTVVFFPQEGADIKVDATHFGGTAGTFSGGRPEVNATHLAGTAYASADFSTTMKASINTEADTALTDYGALKPTTAGRTLLVDASGYVTYVNAAPPTAAAIADALLDEPVSDHLTVGSTGAILADTNADAHLSYQDWENGGRLDLLLDAVKAKTDNLPAAPAATGDIPSVSAIADGVWDEVLSGHLTGGTTGAGLNAAGSAGDPWGTALPGAYTAGSAGYILGTNLNATVSSRSSHSAADVWSAATRTLTAFAFTVTTSDSANITAILADTNELQQDWANGGRLDLILDARASQTSVDDVPTNAEFNARTLVAADYATATALAVVDGIADDILVDTGTTLPAQISGLSIPTTTQIADAVLSRNVSNVESSAGEHTLCTIVLAGLESSVSGTTWTIKRTDGSTTHAAKTVAVDAAADPITGVS